MSSSPSESQSPVSSGSSSSRMSRTPVSANVESCTKLAWLSHLSGDLDVLLVPRARGSGDGAAACLGMNRTIPPSQMKKSSSTRSSIVICSLRFYRNLQPWLDSFDPFNFFNFTISGSAGPLPTIQRGTVLQVWPRSCRSPSEGKRQC
jgi:hypothetical protein